MYAPHRGDGLNDLIGIHVDDLDHRRPGNRGIDLAGRATGGDVVGPGSQRNAFDDFEAAGIDDIDADVMLVGHVVLGAFGVDGDAMGEAQAFDDADDLVGRRVDQICIGAAGTRLRDNDGRPLLARQRRTLNLGRQRPCEEQHYYGNQEISGIIARCI